MPATRVPHRSERKLSARVLKRVATKAGVLAAAVAATQAVGRRAAASPPSGAGYDLVFADEFNGSALDTMKWNYNYPWGHTHNHRAYMDASQVIVGNGHLDLQAIAQRDPAAPLTTTSGGVTYSLDYTSGAVNTSGKFNATNGYFEARIKMADVAGTWPAFWMLQNGWPPEVDIMEFPRGSNNSRSQYWANYHYTGSNGAASYGWQMSGTDMTSQYNDFGVEWTPTSMGFYLNGALQHTVTNTNAIAQSANMYMILNQAVGGWPGDPPSNTPFPSDYLIDWVRVWQKRPSGASTTSTWNVNGGGSWDAAANWTGIVPNYGNQVVNFGRVGTVGTAIVTWSNIRTAGSINFSGDAIGTTAYTLGSNTCGLQMVNSSGTATITAASTSTANQGIAARIELYNNTQVVNDMSGKTLTLGGQIVGSGGLIVDGAGTVTLTKSNTYTGGTTLDSGTQGPAVLRASASGALGTGTVVIGPSGNSTTARLEIAFAQLSNNIDFRARNNSSVGIESITGTNTLSGTITANVGGGIYQIQSDLGTLTLSGADPGATAPGVAIQAGSGSRIITLQGAGTGVVSGIIRNGAGTMGIAKDGAGTWTLSGANTYTGPTSAAAGKLVTGTLTTSSSLSASGTGTIELAQGGATVVATPSVATSGSGKIDLKDNAVIVTTAGQTGSWNGTAYSGVTGMVAAGRGDGTWNGAGVTTSLAGGSDYTTLGVAKAGDISGMADAATTSFAGQTVHGSDTIAAYTYGGDANLDGVINIDDYTQIDSSVSVGGSLKGWFNGDFNFDGNVDIDDYTIIDSNIGIQGAPLAGAAAAPLAGFGNTATLTAIPEPAGMTWLAAPILAGATARVRRRRSLR